MSELDVEWDDPDCDAKGITEHSCMEMQHTRCSSSSSRKSSFFFVFLFLCAPIGTILLQPLPRLSGTLQMADLWMSDRRNAIGVDHMQSIDLRRGMLTRVHGQDLLT